MRSRSTAVLGLALLALLPLAARAAVTSSGLVSPTNVAADPTQSGTEMRIGDDSLGDPEDNDPRAKVTVNGGDLLQFDQIFVGYDVGFFGRLEASGEGTLVQLSDGGANNDAALEVGRQGNGYASFTNGASLILTSTTADLVIASDVDSVGEMLIDTGSYVDLDEDIIVGDAGAGRLTIAGGSLVRTTDVGSSSVIIGDEVTGSGYVTVDGPQTVLQLSDELTVGRLGIGELTISNGAMVDADAPSSQTTIGALGRVYLASDNPGSVFDKPAVLDVTDLDVNGYLGGHGIVRGQVDVAASGRVEANPGQQLDFEDAFNNSGAVTLTGSEMRTLDTATTTGTGRYTLEDGTLRFSQAHDNNGVIASAEGTNNIHGDITNNGNVVVASESVAVFNDTYTDAGTTTVLARGNALFLANLTFTSTALLSLEFGDGEEGDAPAQVHVSGAASLDGSLDIDFGSGFSPSSSQSRRLLHADGGISGQFVPPVFPQILGVDFQLFYDPNGVTLDIQIDPNVLLDGDFNLDGVVDSVDYAVWREGLNTIYTQTDFQAWINNYGRTTNAPETSQPVPAPSGLLGLASMMLLVARRRQAGGC